MSIFLGTGWRTCVSCTRQLQRPLVTFLLILLTLSMTRYLGSGWLEGMWALWILKLIMTCLCFLLALCTCRSTSISCQAYVLFSRPLVLLHFTPLPLPALAPLSHSLHLLHFFVISSSAASCRTPFHPAVCTGRSFPCPLHSSLTICTVWFLLQNLQVLLF